MAKELENPRPIADWETRGYWEGAGRHELVLQRCRACATVQHRPRALCVTCLKDEIEHFVASGRGTVYTFTVTEQNQAPPFRDVVPYVLAYVELEEGPLFISNPLHLTPEDLKPQLPVTVAFLPCEDSAGSFKLPVFRKAQIA